MSTRKKITRKPTGKQNMAMADCVITLQDVDSRLQDVWFKMLECPAGFTRKGDTKKVLAMAKKAEAMAKRLNTALAKIANTNYIET